MRPGCRVAPQDAVPTTLPNSATVKVRLGGASAAHRRRRARSRPRRKAQGAYAAAVLVLAMLAMRNVPGRCEGMHSGCAPRAPHGAALRLRSHDVLQALGLGARGPTTAPVAPLVRTSGEVRPLRAGRVPGMPGRLTPRRLSFAETRRRPGRPRPGKRVGAHPATSIRPRRRICTSPAGTAPWTACTPSRETSRPASRRSR